MERFVRTDYTEDCGAIAFDFQLKTNQDYLTIQDVVAIDTSNIFTVQTNDVSYQGSYIFVMKA